MNVPVQFAPLPLSTVPGRQDTNARLVVGGGTVPVKAWEAADWRELVERYSKGERARRLEEIFVPRGYSAHEIRLLRLLVFMNPYILPPLERALYVLGGLGRSDARAPGGFVLNGRPARAVEVVAAANRILDTLALPQIRYPSAAASEA